ncbi:hypothetical protein [Janthinobacterium sp. FT14W]|nr:hypothetical protein [Janthinobacterium sp. FT14W]
MTWSSNEGGEVREMRNDGQLGQCDPVSVHLNAVMVRDLVVE